MARTVWDSGWLQYPYLMQQYQHQPEMVRPASMGIARLHPTPATLSRNLDLPEAWLATYVYSEDTQSR